MVGASCRVAWKETVKMDPEGVHTALHQFRAMIDHSQVCLAYLDPQFNFLEVNSAYAMGSGYSREELIGRNHFDLFPHDENQAIFEQARDTGQPVEYRAKPFEFADQPERGVTYWDWTLTPVQDSEGIVQGLVLSLQDVSARVQAQQEGEKAHEHFRKDAEVHAALSALYRPLVSPFTTIEAVARVVLDQARRLTSSPHGYVGTLDPASGDLVSHTLTEMLAGGCQVTEKDSPIIFPRGSDGIYPGLWGHSLNTRTPFISNEPQVHPASKGIPHGHILLHRFLSVPVLLGDELVGQISLSNADEDYAPHDVQTIERLAEFFALAIQRMRFEALLKKERDFSSAVLDTAGALTLVMDTQGRIIRFNRACEMTTGYTFQEVQVQPFWDLFLLPEDVELVQEVFARLTGGSFPSQHSNYWVTKDGRQRWITWTNTALVSAAGAVEYVIGTGIDTTEQREAENALRSNEEKLRALVEILPIGISVLDHNRKLHLANPALARILHLSEEQLWTGAYERRSYLRADGTLMPADEFPSAVAFREQQPIRDVEIGISCEGGDQIWTSVSAAPLPFSDWNSVIATVDITARKRAEAALQQARDELEMRVQERTAELNLAVELLRTSEQRFRQMAENIHEVFWMADVDLRQLHYISPAFEEVWGRTCQSLYEDPPLFVQTIHPEDRDWVRASLPAMSSGTYDEQFRIVRPDGATRWVRTRAFPVHDPQGRIYRIAGFAEDITEQRQSQEALLRTEKLAVAGRLAASLGHEINNPLQSAIGCIGLIEESLTDHEDLNPYFSVASDALQRAAQVVAQLRTLHLPAQVEERRPSQVNELLNKVLLLTTRQLRSQSIQVDLDLDEKLPSTGLMPNALQQVFLNLVLNAIDAMPQGGRLQLATRWIPQPAGVEIRITDSGQGLDPKVRDHLFEAFCSTKSDGLGLGLFISHSIVKQHGGKISAESQPGKGTTFTIWLPARPLQVGASDNSPHTDEVSNKESES